MRSRTPCSPPAWPVAVAVSMLVVGAGSPCLAQQAEPDAKAPKAAPAASAPASSLRLHAARPTLHLRQGVSSGATLGAGDAASAPGSQDPPVIATRAERMRRAFEEELKDEAIRSRRASLYATIPVELPELLEDSFVRREQARVAESCISGAFEAALSEGFFGGKRHSSNLTIRPTVAVAKHGISLDASPSWTYRVQGPRSGFRFELPLLSSNLKLSAYRDLDGTNRTKVRLTGGLTVDPFDEEIRAGIGLQF